MAAMVGKEHEGRNGDSQKEWDAQQTHTEIAFLCGTLVRTINVVVDKGHVRFELF